MDDLIFGKNCLIEALKAQKRNINKILISKNLHHSQKIDEIISLAKQNGVVFNFVLKEKIESLFDEKVNHQGVVGFASPVEYCELDDFLYKYKQCNKTLQNSKKNLKLLILDGIEDPHNLGAIVRTCVCANYDAIIIPARRSALINSTVQKTSAGAVNHIPIIKVNSLNSVIDTLKKEDIWIIATSLYAKDNYFEIDYQNMNFAIIMGSEGKGVNKTLLNKADFRIKIPMLCDFNSLNVSNATAIVVYESIRADLLQNSKSVI